MITKELQETLNLAAAEAVVRRHEMLTLEHLLYALLRDSTGNEVIVRCGGDIERLRIELEQFFDEQMVSVGGTAEHFPQFGEELRCSITRLPLALGTDVPP